jgi:hypothetical protein
LALFSRQPKISKLRRRGDVEGLRAALAHRDLVFDVEGRPVDLGAPVRREAVAALGELGGREAAEALLDALHDHDPAVRLGAVRSLRGARERLAVDGLIAAALSWPEHPHGAARSEAIEALVELSDPYVVERFALALAHRSNGAGPRPEHHGLWQRVVGSGGQDGRLQTTAVEAMVVALRYGDAQLQRGAERVLGWIGEPSVGHMIDALADPRLRRAAASVLGEARDSRAVEGLTRVCADGDPEVRRTAVWALGEIRDPRAVEALLCASTDPVYDVRAEAANALDKLGTVAAVMAIGSWLRPLMGSGWTPAGRPELRPPAGRPELRPPAALPLRARTRAAARRMLARGRARRRLSSLGALDVRGRVVQQLGRRSSVGALRPALKGLEPAVDQRDRDRLSVAP